LAPGTLHELSPTASVHFGAAAGFALALAVRASGGSRPVLWITHDFAIVEAGGLYGPGLDLFGLPMERLVLLRAPRPIDALWAMEEALKCRAVAAVIAELTEEGLSTDLTATRRLVLAAREGGGLGLLLRHRPSYAPSAATTRWQIEAVPSEKDQFGGLGRPAFTVSLIKNRHGPSGRWTLAWDQHERIFIPAALSLGVVAAARDGSDRAMLLARAG
jgi:protein ImuA